ncbi:MAG: biotin--[acetyl-CoA-carboxylase] ligase [Defluviitaleaceae bacterium]|nr:biotin--[acetyl-CoA-carboxylase] ligase [Defluviitaleaceae bacterium]
MGMASPDILCAEGIGQFLSGDTARIVLYPALESTNKTAKALAAAGGAHGTVILAEQQTAGRGRFGRSFFSPPGHGIYMSLILRPAGGLTATALTIRTAVCVCQAIEAFTDKTPCIKWVNDIFIGGKKICGILTEAVTGLENGHLPWMVVGIGVNVTTLPGNFPAEIQSTAGSIFGKGQPAASRNRLAAEIINRVFDLENTCSAQALCEYKKRLMMLGKKISVTGHKELFEATALDIDDIGRLIVQKDSGEILALSSGEVSIKI